MRKKLIAVAMSSWLISPALMAGSEIETLINMLHENGMVTDAQMQRLQNELQETRAKQALQQHELETQKAALTTKQAELDKQLAEAKAVNNIQISPQGGLAVRSKDGDFETKIGGRLQADAANYSGDGDYGDGTTIRRARLSLSGKVYRDWGYKIEYDFAGDTLNDAFIAYNGLQHYSFTVGNFKDPFILEQLISANNVTFIERSLVSGAFDAGRHIGAMVERNSRHWTVAAGLFGDRVNDRGGSDDEGWGWGTRVTWAPINMPGKLLHFGGGLNYRDLQPNNMTRFRQQPETSIAGVNVVDTSDLQNANSQFKSGLDLATTIGQFSAQAEYLQTNVEIDNGIDADFTGWYLQSSYFLTADSRPYKNGSFGMINPTHPLGKGGYGAWELAARLSNVDLNDGMVNGGEADSMTLGVNWYPLGGLRFSANYTDVLDVDGGPQDGLAPKIFQLRSQWAF